MTHSWVEVGGFWIVVLGMLGSLMGILLLSLPEKSANSITNWIEKRLRIPWYLQILVWVGSIILDLIGMHMMCVGGQGRYPGYPMDIIIAWWNG